MSSGAGTNIESVLKETRKFPPPAEFSGRAHIKSLAEYERIWQEAKANPEAFWARHAEGLHWSWRCSGDVVPTRRRTAATTLGAG